MSGQKPSDETIRAAIKRITEWLTEQGEQKPKPKRGVPSHEAQIAILKFLAEEAIEKRDSNLRDRNVAQIFKPPKKNIRPILGDLRKSLLEFQSVPASADSSIKVSLPKGHIRLAFEGENRTINALAFWRLLLAVCREDGLSPKELEEKFWTEWVDDPDIHGDFHTFAGSRRNNDNPIEQERFFSSAILGQSKIAMEEAWGLLNKLDINRLMFDPLLSTVREQKALELSLDQFFSPRIGEIAYKIPQERLACSEVALVRLSLRKGERSNIHEHPGDELLFVLKGKAEFTLLHSGVSTLIGAGEYVHFWAEQKHMVVPRESDTLMLIIRLYQAGATDTRQEMRREVDLLNPAKPLSNLTHWWVRQVMASRPQKAASYVRDRIGLARLLKRMSKYNEKRGFRPREATAIAKMREWENADRAATVANLPEIGASYDIQEFLLSHYLYPAFPGIVVVRRDNYEPGSSKQGKYSYRVPDRNLSGADVTISELTIPPGGEITPNHHPGTELLIPIRGSGEVFYVNGEQRTRISRFSKGEEVYAHYSSERTHTVRNPGTDDAVCFVVRLLRDEALAESKPIQTAR
jgi:quercetin dioxygenase-like cupin family protein